MTGSSQSPKAWGVFLLFMLIHAYERQSSCADLMHFTVLRQVVQQNSSCITIKNSSLPLKEASAPSVAVPATRYTLPIIRLSWEAEKCKQRRSSHLHDHRLKTVCLRTAVCETMIKRAKQFDNEESKFTSENERYFLPCTARANWYSFGRQIADLPVLLQLVLLLAVRSSLGSRGHCVWSQWKQMCTPGPASRFVFRASFSCRPTCRSGTPNRARVATGKTRGAPGVAAVDSLAVAARFNVVTVLWIKLPFKMARDPLSAPDLSLPEQPR